MYTFYHYWRSSSSWRVRWALAIKAEEVGLKFQYRAIDLLNGESESPEHLARNPAGFVPVLEMQDSKTKKPLYLAESLALIDYLETAHPGRTKLLPTDPIERARAWALAEVINSGTQPLQNIPVMNYHSPDPTEQKRWNRHWIRNGLEVFNQMCGLTPGPYSCGDSLTIADLCLMPQLYNAERFEVDIRDLNRVSEVSRTCASLSTYLASHPDRFKPNSQ